MSRLYVTPRSGLNLNRNLILNLSLNLNLNPDPNSQGIPLLPVRGREIEGDMLLSEGLLLLNHEFLVWIDQVT